MTRPLVALFSLLIFIAAPVCTPAATPKVDPASAATDAVMAELPKRMDEFKWSDAPLDKVLKDISTKLGVNIVIDAKTIAATDPIDHMKVTLTARSVTLDELLELLAISQRLTLRWGYYVVGNNIVITTEDAAHRKKITRTYKVADLIPGPTRGRDFDQHAYDDAALRLMSVIASSAESESWQTVSDIPWTGAGAAPFGTLRNFEGTLIVTTSPSIHLKVAAFLEELRKKDVRGEK